MSESLFWYCVVPLLSMATVFISMTVTFLVIEIVTGQREGKNCEGNAATTPKNRT